METMTPREAIKKIQRDEGIIQEEIAKRTGFSGQKAISKFTRHPMKVSVFSKILGCMGWEIIIRPMGSENEQEYIKIDEEFIRKGESGMI
jgi:hypothetical protein